MKVVANLNISKSPEIILNKADTNLNKINQNQKSNNNLKVLNNLESLKLVNNNYNAINNNQNNTKTSTNFNKFAINPASTHMKKNSENLFLVKNNNINLNSNSTSERASFSQIRQEQFNKTNTFKPLELISPESERNSKNKSESSNRKIQNKIRKCP